MKRDILDIVKEKQFIELTPEERSGLTNYCTTEDEYNQLKQVLVGVNAMDWTNPVPRAETKDRLDVLFAQSYPKLAPVWYSNALTLVVPKHKPFQRQPLVQIAAVGLLALLTVPFFNSDNDLKDSRVVVAENKSEKDSNEETLDALVNTETPDIDDEVIVVNDVAQLPITSRDVLSSSGVAVASSDIPASKPGFDHPDGVHKTGKTIAYSLPASDQPEDLLDLLTSTF